jgi:mercuric ion transport protein
MNKTSSQTSKKGMFAAFTGTVLVALCCFTPILVVLLGAIGLSAFTPYLDMVLLPALGIMIVVSMVSYLRWRKSAKKEL